MLGTKEYAEAFASYFNFEILEMEQISGPDVLDALASIGLTLVLDNADAAATGYLEAVQDHLNRA